MQTKFVATLSKKKVPGYLLLYNLQGIKLGPGEPINYLARITEKTLARAKDLYTDVHMDIIPRSLMHLLREIDNQIAKL